MPFFFKGYEETKSIILVSYNLSLIFVVLAIIYISNSKILLTKLIADMEKHGNIIKKKHYGVRKSSSQTFIQTRPAGSIEKQWQIIN